MVISFGQMQAVSSPASDLMKSRQTDVTSAPSLEKTRGHFWSKNFYKNVWKIKFCISVNNVILAYTPMYYFLATFSYSFLEKLWINCKTRFKMFTLVIVISERSHSNGITSDRSIICLCIQVIHRNYHFIIEITNIRFLFYSLVTAVHCREASQLEKHHHQQWKIKNIGTNKHHVLRCKRSKDLLVMYFL